MNIGSVNSRFSRLLIFPNVLDFIVMLVLVALSQMIVVRSAEALGLNFPTVQEVAAVDHNSDFTLSDAPSGTIPSVEEKLELARSLMIVYIPAMLLSIASILLYRRFRGSSGRIVRFSPAGFNPTLLLCGVIWMISVNIMIEPLLIFMPKAPDIVGRGFFALLVTVFIAPFCEEFLCRGVVLESFRAKYGVVWGWIFSSLFFAIIHAHITAMVNALVIGSIIGYICIRSKSVISAILLHMINNALALTAISFGVGDKPLVSLLPSSKIADIVYLASVAVSLVGFIVLVTGLAAERRAEKRAAAEKTLHSA